MEEQQQQEEQLRRYKQETSQHRKAQKLQQVELSSIRGIFQKKENVIENMMFRYDIGLITQDPNMQGPNLSRDEINTQQLAVKAQALIKRTEVENKNLEEMYLELINERRSGVICEIFKIINQIHSKFLLINDWNPDHEIYALDKEKNEKMMNLKKIMSNHTVNAEEIGNDHTDNIEDDENDAYDNTKNLNEISVMEQLKMHQKANEIYQQQLKYVNDHMISMEELLLDKTNIIQNLILRYDLFDYVLDENTAKDVASVENGCSINYELRELIYEERDYVFHVEEQKYAYQTLLELDIDQYAKLHLETSGYLRNYERLLLNENDIPYYNIPHAIKRIITFYVHCLCLEWTY